VLGGASKLPYALSLLQSSLCNYHVFIDDDTEGRKGYAEAAKSLLCSTSNTTLTKCLGLPEAEFEDLLNEGVYADYFNRKYGVDVGRRPFDQKQKWSIRIRTGLTKSGKGSPSGEAWPEADEYADKRAVAELVVDSPATAIHPARIDVITAFVASIEGRLATLSTGAS
jgi:hypothetical protein